MKKLLALVLAFCMSFAAIPFDISADGYMISGNYKYTVSDNAATIISVNQDISGDIVVPDTLGGFPVKEIEAWAFNDCKEITTVTISEGMVTIKGLAFAYCDKLREIILPDSLQVIATHAVFDCDSIERIHLPKGVKSFHTDAFGSCDNIAEITVSPENRNYHSENNCLIHTQTNRLIKACNTSVIPDYIVTIGEMAFAYCTGLPTIEVPESVTTIEKEAYQMCTKAASISLPNNLTTIGDFAFSNCSSLEKIEIPDSVSSMGDGVFFCCSSLVDIKLPEHTTKLGVETFTNCDKLVTIDLPQDLEGIGSHAFKSCDGLTFITLPENVYYIEEGAFAYCENLTEIKIIGEIVLISKNAFWGNKKLKDVWCSGSVEDWANLKTGPGNTSIKTANWHYNTCPDQHSYTIPCSETCDKCDWPKREKVQHYGKNIITRATLQNDGKISQVCRKCHVNISVKAIKKVKSIKLSATSYTYNGKTKKPTVTVKDSKGKKLKKDVDYTVSYEKGCKKVGTYKVTVTFKGNYFGKKELTFKINPAKTKISKITAGKKSLKIKVAKKTKEVTGYEIQYSTSKKFKSAKKATIKNAKTPSLVIKGLKSQKTYYLRVRTYKMVNGKKYYSGWSAYKTKKSK